MDLDDLDLIIFA